MRMNAASVSSSDAPGGGTTGSISRMKPSCERGRTRSARRMKRNMRALGWMVSISNPLPKPVTRLFMAGSSGEAVTRFVNRVSARLWNRHPDLNLLFGLHATSVSRQLRYIRQVDPRIHHRVGRIAAPSRSPMFHRISDGSRKPRRL